jgi:hypothetical protein
MVWWFFESLWWFCNGTCINQTGFLSNMECMGICLQTNQREPELFPIWNFHAYSDIPEKKYKADIGINVEESRSESGVYF